jgi:zinc protease
MENGLEVIVREARGSNAAALVVLYDIGGNHDPEGASGLGHLIEHCYVTSAAGDHKSRTMQEYVARYKQGWNAQTGCDYTVIAAVFPANRLEQEIADAAARMGDLRVTEPDLQREKPRMYQELSNMFGGIPNIAAPNLSRERVLPTPLGGRKGGIMEHISGISLQTVKGRVKDYYGPNNATLVLAGDFDRDRAMALITKYFGSIPRVKDVPEAPADPEPGPGDLQTVKVRPVMPNASSVCSVTFRAPRPTNELYCAFLAAMARLHRASSQTRTYPPRFQVMYRLLDDPDVVSISVYLKKGETPAQSRARMETIISSILERPYSSEDGAMARNMFGYFAGLVEWPASQAGKNLYGYAFAVGRRRQLGSDPARLRKALESLDEETFRRAVKKYFAEGPAGRAVVVPEKK